MLYSGTNEQLQSDLREEFLSGAGCASLLLIADSDVEDLLNSSSSKRNCTAAAAASETATGSGNHSAAAMAATAAATVTISGSNSSATCEGNAAVTAVVEDLDANAKRRKTVSILELGTLAKEQAVGAGPHCSEMSNDKPQFVNYDDLGIDHLRIAKRRHCDDLQIDKQRLTKMARKQRAGVSTLSPTGHDAPHSSQDAITALSRSVSASVVRNVTAAQDAPT